MQQQMFEWECGIGHNHAIPMTGELQMALAQGAQIGCPYMNTQRPLSHTHDPSTSHAAERSIRDSGALETHNKAMAWLVARHPGLTASEYYAKSQDYPERFKGWDLQEIRRRLTTNMPAHVYQGEARIGLRKKKEVSWWPK